MKYIIIILAFLLIMPSVNAHIAVSSIGYHPDEIKNVIVYTTDNDGIINLVGPQGSYNIQLTKPLDSRGQTTNCQGGQSCLIADITGIKTEGNYQVKYKEMESSFKIDKNSYYDTLELYLEYFNAHMMHNSSYHGNWFGAESPRFAIMSDGAFIMHADQATTSLIRLSEAYEYNPTFVYIDNYFINKHSTPDIIEYIFAYTDYLLSIQDARGDMMIPIGHGDNWGEWSELSPSVERYTDEPAPFMNFINDTIPLHTTKGLLAFSSALFPIAEYDKDYSLMLLKNTEKTYLEFQKKYNIDSLTSNEKAFLGAALFKLYDATGNEDYLIEAYNLRLSVDKVYINDVTRGNEFYWEEYIRHKDDIIEKQLTYTISGTDPLTYVHGKMYFDYKDRGEMSISSSAENVYIFDNNIKFQNSRYKLIESVLGERSGLSIGYIISTSQLHWLSGKNSVYYEGIPQSVHFISGLGEENIHFHSRLRPYVRNESNLFMNGKAHVPGWISGAYDNNGDNIFNYETDGLPYSFTETTNEIVSLALMSTAMIDARLNNIEILPREQIGEIDNISEEPITPPEEPPLSPPEEVSCGINDISVVCEGIIIQDESLGSCRQISCEGDYGSLSVLACEKNDIFEVYAQEAYGFAPIICIGKTCMDASVSGFAQGSLVCEKITECKDFWSLEVSGPGFIEEKMESGCRAFILTNNDGSADVVACPKEDGFEMYSRIIVGNPGYICLEDNCMIFKDSGFLKVDSYCEQIKEEPVINPPEEPITPPEEPINPPDKGLCYDNVVDIPAVCNGGIITTEQSILGGGKEIICENNNNMLYVTAWNKDNNQYFEMYKQGQAGTGIEICLLDNCISTFGSGFERSNNFPLCIIENESEEPTILPPEKPIDKEPLAFIPREPLTKPIIIENFTNHSYVNWFPTGTVVQTNGLLGEAVKITTAGIGLPAAIEHTYPDNISLEGKIIAITLKVSDITRLDHLWLQTTNNEWNDWILWELEGHLFSHDKNNWVTISIPVESGKYIGNPSYDTSTFRIRVGDDGTGSIEVSIDRIEIVDLTEPVISITFDDGWDSQYTHAYPIMEEFGFAGTTYIIPHLIGEYGYNTEFQLKTLYDSGWDISGHDHPSLEGLSYEEKENRLVIVKNYLYDKGFIRGLNHYSYPQGYYNEEILEIMKNNYHTGRTIIHKPETLPPFNPYRLRTFLVLESTGDTEIINAITQAKNNGEWLIITYHRIEYNPQYETEISPDTFRRHMNIIKDSGIKVMPISEAYEKYTIEAE